MLGVPVADALSRAPAGDQGVVSVLVASEDVSEGPSERDIEIMVRVNSVEDMKVDAVTGDFSLEDVLAEQKKDDWCITRSKELDGKSVLTNSPLAHYTPATCEFDSGDILSAPFSLTQKGLCLRVIARW
eukprot:CAMPEP_0197301678 /NCGR_PEP_ID=MMETSP0890-20130614/50551_1 /TAXON_ID=44058 ORGANISM="Aureoumbra lagunensis, Strain CCMP1510" /NCGR_SAMPLE_ID=MMETSP0890 /ASSEMBLY_ACC=CAM_ASM_000533 /LENGTH=128 /DNA_ID=CAMNT_0042781041 /DNA_START=1313 /DNA_END=1695 /DNA_ORIENTATION=+